MIALLNTLDLVLNLYSWVIIIASLFSWLISFGVINNYNEVVQSMLKFAAVLTDKPLSIIRKFLPVVNGIDLSPLVLLLMIYFLRQLIWTSFFPVMMESVRRLQDD